jgi:hypothetical protein
MSLLELEETDEDIAFTFRKAGHDIYNVAGRKDSLFPVLAGSGLVWSNYSVVSLLAITVCL